MSLTNIDQKIILSLKEIQKQSYDPVRPVAVIIADNKGEILSTGVNRPPLNLKLNIDQAHIAIEQDPNWKYYMLEHAERNAIYHALNTGVSLKGTSMYGTLFPCSDCARAIVVAGIKRLVVPNSGLCPERDEKWNEHYLYAKQIFEAAGTNVENYMVDDL